jgi:hypothetical protein
MADRMSERPPNIVRASDEHTADRPLGAAAAVTQRRSSRSDSSPHAHKFRVATVMLAGLAIGAIVIAVTILSQASNGGPSQQWSQWHPLDGGVQGAREIADHLAPFYRIDGVNQLAVVTVINLGNPNDVNPTTGAPQGLQVAVRTDPSSGSLSLLSGNTIAFDLCGIGSSNCAIGVGKPSSLRLLLLKREALELALYTFKYIPSTDNVVAILPPGTTKTTPCVGLCATPQKTTTQHVDLALLFLHDELQPFLTQPLNQTLTSTYPPPVAELPLWAQTQEAGLVEQVTARGLFSEQTVNAQDGSNMIELNQLPPS